MTKRMGYTFLTLGIIVGMFIGTMVPQVWGHDQRGRPIAPPRQSLIWLPRLPDNVKTITNITNDPKVGVSVGFINTDGKPEMVQYSFEYSNTGNFDAVYNKHFHFKFREQ